MPAIYLIDERVSQSHVLLANVPKNDFGFIVTSYMAIAEIVSTVLKRITTAPAPEPKPAPKSAAGPVLAGHRAAAPQKSRTPPKSNSVPAPLINSLRIIAHGDSEHIHLGWGIHARNIVQLMPLTPHMLAGAGGECLLLGCNIAMNFPRVEDYLGGAAIGQRFGTPLHGWSATDLNLRSNSGYELLFRLARTLGVPATASLDTQSIPYDWHITGRTITVEPDGQVSFTGVDTPATI